MLEIFCKILFFLSMLIVYANVTSTSNVIVIVCGYVACVISYYYFNNIRGAIDEWVNYFNVNARLNDTMNPSQISGYFVNRKYNKINNNGSIPSVGGKKIFGALCNTENTFPQENSLLDSCAPSIMKTEYKSNGDLPSPIMKNGSPRSNRLSREKLKINFDSKAEISTRKNMPQIYNPLGPTRRYNVNLDLETFMNVNSPGFTSRVVDKAAESASYHMKYPAVRQVSSYRFDKSTIRQLSKMPKASSTPTVRIAAPEPATIDLLNGENLSNEATQDDIKGNNFLQVLKDISRKRNYTQEETDRSGSTPKKSRKTDVKNVMSSQYKRAHEDCSNDSIEDKSRKKRCDDSDRNYAKMMSFTSSMSVLAPEFSWSTHSKKRKSSKLEKSKNESSEKLEKFRKISEDSIEEVEEKSAPTVQPKPKNNATYSVKSKAPEIQVQKDSQNSIQNAEETDSKFVEMFPTDEDGEYVRVAGGKILNRTNCTYRKKLNNTKIDPVSVIATEPEYVSGSSYVDDKTMKENLLNNLMNDIERKGEKNDSVIFYQNSIVEEIEKNVTHVEVHQTDTAIHTSSTFNPLLPPTLKPATKHVHFSDPVVSSLTSNSASNTSLPNTNDNSSLLTNGLKHNAETNGSFAFGVSKDTVDSPKPVPSSAIAKSQDTAVLPNSFNFTSTSTPTVVTSSPAPANAIVKSSPTASVSLSFGTSNTQTSAYASTDQSPLFGGAQTTVPSAVESNIQTNVSQSSMFSPSTQTTSQGLVFGASTLTTTQPSVSGTSTQSVEQQSVLSNTSQANTSTSGTTQSLFGARDTSSNVFGQAQASAPPMSGVIQPPQTTQFGSGTSTPGFTFSTSQPPAFPSSSFATTAASSFGNATTAQPTFNTNTPSFNFSGSSSFGAIGNSAFGGSSASQPTNNQTFAFGSSNTPTTQPAQSSFQFGASTTTPSSQQFSFGGNVAQEKNDNVKFFQNGVGQAVDKNANSQPATNNVQFNAPAISSATNGPTTNASSSLFGNVFKSNSESGGSFAFGASSSSKQTPANKIPEPSVNLFNTTSAGAGTVMTSSAVAPVNATMGLSQTTPASSTFGTGNTQSSMFGSATQTNNPQPSIFGGAQTNATQPTVFGSNMQTNTPQPSVFGSGTQTASQGLVFGSNTQSSSQPSIFVANTQAPTSQSVFGSASQVNTSVSAQPSLFGAGDTSNNIFGQPQASAPPVGVVNPLPQASQFGSGSSNERGFAFGAGQPPAFGSTPVAAPVSTTFGSVTTVRPAFNSSTPSFNFPASTGFGAGGNSNTFGATSAPQPANNQIFEFGSSNAPSAQPPQSTFQFGASTSTMANSQPFMFGGGAAPAPTVATNAGGFSIGSGGSNTRGRAMARSRKAK